MSIDNKIDNAKIESETRSAMLNKPKPVCREWYYSKTEFPYKMLGRRDDWTIDLSIKDAIKSAEREANTQASNTNEEEKPNPDSKPPFDAMKEILEKRDHINKICYPEGLPTKLFTEEVVTFEGNDFTQNDDFRTIRMLVHRPKTSKYSASNPPPAMLYFHGGGAIALSAECVDELTQNYSDTFDIVVFNLDYRLAPETIAPNNCLDAYAGLKYVLKHSNELGIDPNRITCDGESAGGYISIGQGLALARRNESHLVKFIVGSHAMIGYEHHNLTKEFIQSFGHTEDTWDGQRNFQRVCFNAMGGLKYETVEEQFENEKGNVDVFIANMDDELAEKFPKTVLFSSEYDDCRIGCEEMAQKLEKNGRLLDYVVYPGTDHTWFCDDLKLENETTRQFYEDYKKILDKYLI